jgi:hypothetical protein
MFPTAKTQLVRMSACRSDLIDNGINPDTLGPRALCDLARRNLPYFQAMLGYDAGLREVVELIGRSRDSVRTSRAQLSTGRGIRQ